MRGKHASLKFGDLSPSQVRVLALSLDRRYGEAIGRRRGVHDILHVVAARRFVMEICLLQILGSKLPEHLKERQRKE
jgi:hypothetical protein